MEDLQLGSTQNQHMHVRHVGWMYVALVVIAFAAVIGTGFGVYYLQQGQVESLERALSEKNGMKVANTKEITPAATTATFNEQQVPYTFGYPADWVKQYDAPIHTNPALVQPKYTITLTAPATVVTNEPIGSDYVRAGARIVVSMQATPQTSVDEWLKANMPASVKLNDRKNTTVAGVPAVAFRSAYESQEGFTTVFIKDAKAYGYAFVAGDGLQTSAYFPAYQDLLASVKFK